MGEHKLGFLLITKGTATRKRTKWGVFQHKLPRKLIENNSRAYQFDLKANWHWPWQSHFNYRANQMQRERCIWVRLYCSSSSSTAQLWVRLCQLVPPWISTMWKGRGSRPYEVRFWANSDWRILHSPSDQVKSLIKSKHCITAPRSYWRSCGGIGTKVAVRTTQRPNTTPKKYTNSTWSTDRQRAVSITSL